MADPKVTVVLDLDGKQAQADIAAFKKKIADVFKGLATNSIGTSLSKGLASLKGFSFSIKDVVNGALRFEKVLNEIEWAIEQKVKAAFASLPATISAVAAKFKDFGKTILDTLQYAWIRFPYIVSNAFSIVKTSLTSALTSIKKFGRDVLDTLQYAWIRFPYIAYSAMTTVKSKLTSFLKTLASIQFRPWSIIQGLHSIATGFVAIISKASSLKALLPTVWRGFTTGFSIFAKTLAKIPGLIAGAISSVGRFAFSLKGLALALGTGAVGAGIFKTAAIAEDVERAQWKFNVMFSDIKAEANATAKEIADTFKVNLGSIQSQMARAADVIQPLGLANDMILEMTRNIGLLSQGAEAWTEGRYDAERASTALMKALTGEKEMLKEFGVVITDQEVWDAVRRSGKELSRANFAIAIYNKILERTPKLQEAAFGRIQEFTGRLSQLKESFKTLAAAIGNFTKPIVTAFLNLGAAIQRKLAEVLGARGFKEWKQLSVEIADRINFIAQKIEGLNITKIKDDFEKIKQSLYIMTKGILQAFGDAFLKMAVAMQKTLAKALAWGFKEGFSTLKDMLPGAAKALASDMYKVLANPARFLYEQGVKGQLTETEKYFATMGGTGKFGNPFANIAFDFGKDMKKTLEDAIRPLKDLGGPNRPTPTPRGFSGAMGMIGADIGITPEQKFRYQRFLDSMKSVDWDIKKSQTLLDKATTQPTKEASMEGLADAYFSMLTRAAGGGKTTQQSVEDLQHKVEELELKRQRLTEEANIYLKTIAEAIGKTPEQGQAAMAAMGYGP